MKQKPILIALVLTAFAGCGDERTGQVVDEGAVPEGAVPAADDYRPDAPLLDDATPVSAADAAPDTATAVGSDTLTTGPDAGGRIRPR